MLVTIVTQNALFACQARAIRCTMVSAIRLIIFAWWGRCKSTDSQCRPDLPHHRSMQVSCRTAYDYSGGMLTRGMVPAWCATADQCRIGSGGRPLGNTNHYPTSGPSGWKDDPNISDYNCHPLYVWDHYYMNLLWLINVYPIREIKSNQALRMF